MDDTDVEDVRFHANHPNFNAEAHIKPVVKQTCNVRELVHGADDIGEPVERRGVSHAVLTPRLQCGSILLSPMFSGSSTSCLAR